MDEYVLSSGADIHTTRTAGNLSLGCCTAPVADECSSCSSACTAPFCLMSRCTRHSPLQLCPRSPSIRNRTNEIFTSELYSWFKKTQQCRHIPKGPPQPPEERYPQSSNCLSASCVVHWEIKWCGLCLFESLFSLSRFVFFQLSKNNY